MKKQTAKERMNDTLLEMATALYDVGEIDAITMKKYETLGAPKIKNLSSKEIKRLRIKEKVSQSVFAKLLNISPETVKKWEQGERHPTGASLKLLNLVASNGLNVLCQQ
jgi:putative transcriptional regulator